VTGIRTLGFGRKQYSRFFVAIAGLLVYCALDTTEQTLVYRGCQLKVAKDVCQPADISGLPADLYGRGIMLSGTKCTCNSAFCNNAPGRRRRRAIVDNIDRVMVSSLSVLFACALAI